MNVLPTQQGALLTIDQVIQQAIAHHRQGQLPDAERLYRIILQTQPNHPDANHNLGVLAVQVKQLAAALPHFKLALEANPSQGQYWLSYIDALIQAGQGDAARQWLEQGRQRGLQGEVVETLAGRLEGIVQIVELSNAGDQQAHREMLPVSLDVPNNSKEKAKSKSTKLVKSGGNTARQHGKSPSPKEINSLVAVFTDGRYPEAETLARTMTERYPLHGFGWKVLGAVFQQLGRSADALASMQKAVTLSPDDAAAHYNLGVVLQDASRLDEAKILYLQAIKIKPARIQFRSATASGCLV